MNVDFVFPLVIIPLFILLAIIARLLTTFIHELGHAIPALIFTNEKVNLYLGSYGDDESRQFKIYKRLTIFYTPNPLGWKFGMIRAYPIPSSSVIKEIIIFISGPLFSLLFGALSLTVVFYFNLHGALKMLLIVFFCSALIDLRNLYPSSTPIKLKNGRIAYCDGYQVYRLLKFKSDQNLISKAYTLYNSKQFNKALTIFEKVRPDYIDDNSFPVMFNCYLQTNDFKKAEAFSEKHKYLITNLSSDTGTLCNIGYMQSNLGNNEIAFDYYNKALEWDNKHSFALCNRGYTYNLFEKYEEAIADFDEVISIEPDSSYAYSNRAYSYIKLKLFDQALLDLDKAMALDNKNPYAYRNSGIYLFEHIEYEKALIQFVKARELDTNTHMINDYIDMAENRISETRLI
jgi:tetratricopeptide (TPR) repeat protein